MTADGRNLTREEWRIIPEFPRYQITSDGDVRRRENFRILTESCSSAGSYYYTLYKVTSRIGAPAKAFRRTYTKLLYSAWPELAPAKAETKSESTRSYSKRGMWEDIPDFPRYQIHPDGLIRYTVSRKFRKIHKDDSAEYVVLINETGEHRRTIKGLLTEVFPAAEAA